MINKNILEKIILALQKHREIKKMWEGERNLEEERYRNEISEFAGYVKQGQDIEPVHGKVILKHLEEIGSYERLIETLDSQGVSEALESYLKTSSDFEELYRQKETEKKHLEKLMRDSSLINI